MRVIDIEPGVRTLINGDLADLTINIGACQAGIHIAEKGSRFEFRRGNKKLKGKLTNQKRTYDSEHQWTDITYQAIEVDFRDNNRVVVFIFWYHELRDTSSDGGIYATHNYDFAWKVDSETVEFSDHKDAPYRCKWDSRGHCVYSRINAFVYFDDRFTDKDTGTWQFCPCESDPNSKDCLHPGEGMSIPRYPVFIK